MYSDFDLPSLQNYSAYTQLAQKFYSRGKLEITFFSCSFNGNAFSWLKVRLQYHNGLWFLLKVYFNNFMDLRCHKLCLNEYLWQHRFKKMIMLSSKLLEPIYGNIATTYIIEINFAKCSWWFKKYHVLAWNTTFAVFLKICISGLSFRGNNLVGRGTRYNVIITLD